MDIQLGRFRIRTLETCRFGLDGGAMFGVVPKPLWSKAYNSGDAQNRIPMAARLLLVQWADKNLLIDTGNGDKLSEKLKTIYALDNDSFELKRSLAELNVCTEDITDVVLTHLHFDHTGGATMLVDNEVVPCFAKAKYYVQKAQYQWAMNPTEKDRASFMKENYEPLHAAGILEMIEGEGEIYPGICVHPLDGHTAAMQMITISDASNTIAFPADLFPTHAHIPVPYVMGYDNFPLTSMEEKRRVLQQSHEQDWTVVYEHDAFVESSKISKNDKGYFADSVVRI